MSNLSMVIVGGGGHTRVLIGMLTRLGLPVHGIVTRDAKLSGSELLGVPVLGLEDVVPLSPAQFAIVNGVGNHASRAGSGLELRADIYARYAAQGFTIASVLSPDAIIHTDVQFGAGAQVMPGAVIQPGARLGKNVIINTRASVDHDVLIHPHAHIAPGAVLCGGVVIGERTHIGAGAVVIENVKIGAGVVIGAGATITRDVADGAVVKR